MKWSEQYTIENRKFNGEGKVTLFVNVSLIWTDEYSYTYMRAYLSCVKSEWKSLGGNESIFGVNGKTFQSVV